MKKVSLLSVMLLVVVGAQGASERNLGERPDAGASMKYPPAGYINLPSNPTRQQQIDYVNMVIAYYFAPSLRQAGEWYANEVLASKPFNIRLSWDQEQLFPLMLGEAIRAANCQLLQESLKQTTLSSNDIATLINGYRDQNSKETLLETACWKGAPGVVQVLGYLGAKPTQKALNGLKLAIQRLTPGSKSYMFPLEAPYGVNPATPLTDAYKKAQADKLQKLYQEMSRSAR